MKFSRILRLFCAVIGCPFFLNSSWQGYLPFNPSVTESGELIRGEFTVPIPPSSAKARAPQYVIGTCLCRGHWPVECASENIKNIDWGKLAKKDKIVASKNAVLLEKWRKEDETAGRLFRPYAFYDVLGLTEFYFRGGLESIARAKKGFTFDKTRLYEMTPLGDHKGDRTTVLKHFPGRAPFYDEMKFYAKTVKELRDMAHATWSTVSAKKGHFEVLNGYEIGGFSIDGLGKYVINQKKVLDGLREADIRYLMEKNPGAAFQIASNFNCLEGGMAGLYAMLEGMQFAPTQGEEASLASMAATIYRKYVADPVDLLDQLSGKLVVKDGRILKVTKVLSEDDIDAVKIGIHEKVVVTSGYYPPFSALLEGDQKLNVTDERVAFLFDNHFVVRGRDPLMVYNRFIEHDKRPEVDQIFTAALNLNEKQTGRKNTSADIASAKVLLKAAYAGTIYAAAALGKKELFLTLVGAGAFKNDLNWIIDALKQHDIIEVVRKSGLKVVLVLYPDLRSDRSFSSTDTALIKSAIEELNKMIDGDKEKEHKDIEEIADQALLDLAHALRKIAEK